jgi:hypothetical protein
MLMITRRPFLFILSCAVTAVTLCADAAAQVTDQFNITVTTTTTNVIPAANNVAANWQMAGMQSVGGIPTRTTVCATVNPIGGGTSDIPNINSAIAGCPAGQVVQLGAGTFSLYSVASGAAQVAVNKGITLRGTGTCNNGSSPYCQTVLIMQDGAIAYGNTCGTQSACVNNTGKGIVAGNNGYYFWSNCGYAAGPTCAGATPLDADAAQGQSTIQVHSTTPFSVGMWVLIDERSGGGYITDSGGISTQVWADANAFGSTHPTTAVGRVIWEKHNPPASGDDFNSTTYPYTANSTGCYFSFCDRPTSEIHHISAIGAGPCPGTNCTLTFDSPLTIAYRQSGGYSAQVYTPYPNDVATPFVENVGIENMTIERTAGGGVSFQYCAHCWVKNVEFYHWTAGAVNVDYSARVQIDTIYASDCTDSEPNGAEYPIDIRFASTEVYVVNSITRLCGKGITARSAGAGSVVAYNWLDQTYYRSGISGNDTWIEMGVNGSHAVGSHHMLFEGNQGANLDNDSTHGPPIYHSFLRNWALGYRTGSFTDPSNSVVVNDAVALAGGGNTTRAGPLRAAGPMIYVYWLAFVGNVLGTSTITTSGNGWAFSGTNFGGGSKQIWLYGWWNINASIADPNVPNFMFRHGNYDYVTGGIIWNSGTPHTIPTSAYLVPPTSAPAFFSAGASCTYPWPWVTPDQTPQIQTNSCGGSGLPALARYNAGTPFVQP